MARNGQRLGLQFLEWTTARRKLDKRLRSLFNEREAFRVEPDPSDPVEVRFASADGSKSVVELRDISVRGLGLRFAHGEGDPPRMKQRVALSIAFPTAPTVVLQVTGEVVMRSVAVEGVLVGVCFEDNKAFQRGEPTIRDYVMQRQVEILRRQRED